MVTTTFFELGDDRWGYRLTTDLWTIVQERAPGVGTFMSREQAESFAAAQAAEALAALEPEAPAE